MELAEIDACAGCQIRLRVEVHKEDALPLVRQSHAQVPDWRTHSENLAELMRRLPHLPFTEPVYRHADFPRASALCMSIFEFAPKSQGARVYRDLAHHVLRVAQPAAAAVSA